MMEVLLIEILLGLLILLSFIYHRLTKNHDYWKKRNVAGPKPILFFGAFKNVIYNKISIADCMKSVYDSYPNEPAVGIFCNTTPALLLKDPDMIKDVLIKSFTTFPDHGITIHEDIEPLAQHLLFFKYKRWKAMRKKLTPTFTSGKLKEMFYLINDCADYFADYLKHLVSKEEIIECFELTAKFTIDVIGVCAFGLNMEALSNEGSEFQKFGRAAFADTWLTKLRLLSRFLPRWIAILFKSFLRDEKAVSFFVNTFKSTMDFRKKNNIRRHDLIDHLIDIRDHPEQVGEEEISDVVLTAQAFIFFVAGFETTSTTISHAMYELALNPDVQDKLRDEVEIVLRQNNGKLSYEALQNMKYLGKVLQETLRKHPTVPMVPREAASDYTFIDSNISITKGTKVFIPVHAIHHNPNIYPDPEKFNPERFNDDTVKRRPQMTYLPFGDGPRICIGERFALITSKLGLATIIRHFKLEICDKTFERYEKRPGIFFISPKNGLYLRIKKL